MAKRHTLIPDNWESIFLRLQELVMANSGEDPFDEIFKILVLKLYCELKMPENAYNNIANSNTVYTEVSTALYEAEKLWPGILGNDIVPKLHDEHLTICMKTLAEVSIAESTLESLDSFFEYLVNPSSKGNKGQFFTPRHVVECCVQITNPGPTDYVIDPACGSGGFLIHTINHQKRHDVLSASDYVSEYIWGFDFDERAIHVAKTMMLVAANGQSKYL